MAEADVASRRAAEYLIEQGRVRVNGALAKLGDKADPEIDVIEVDGERLNFAKDQKKVYFALYKPKNVLTTSVPHRGDERETVLDLVPYKGHLFTIGRLDADSEGLIVLTNDGDLTHKLTHPRYRHTKTYKVTVRGLPSEGVLKRWQDGIWLDDEGKTAPCVVSIIDGAQRETILRITMTEGKKRQIRRVAMALGHPVQRLVRTHLGTLSVEGLRPGEWRELTAQDVNALSTPSSAFKELRARKQAQRDERRSQPRGQMRDAESRPRQRSLIDETTSDERPRRPRYRSDKPMSRSDERPPRSRSDASSHRSQPRQRTTSDETREDGRPRRPSRASSTHVQAPRQAAGDETRDDARPRRPRYRSDGDGASQGERAQRGRSGTSSHRDLTRRPSSDSTRHDERPRYGRDDQATRSGDHSQRRRSSDDDTRSDQRPRRTSDESRDQNRPKSPRRSSTPRGQGNTMGSSRRSSDVRQQRSSDRPPRKSSDSRRSSSSQGKPRSRRGNDEQ